MMKVRIVYHETGTGENDMFDTEVEQVDLPNILKAFAAHDASEEGIDPLNYVDATGHILEHGGMTGFLFLVKDGGFFGDMIFTGVVYTEFV